MTTTCPAELKHEEKVAFVMILGNFYAKYLILVILGLTKPLNICDLCLSQEQFFGLIIGPKKWTYPRVNMINSRNIHFVLEAHTANRAPG